MSTHLQTVKGTEVTESAGDRRVSFLAGVARRTGIQNELLIHPDKVVPRFMDEFVAPVQKWCLDHGDKVSACYLSVYEDIPAVFVVGASTGYDYSLSVPLADLEMDLHRRGWKCGVLQLPGSDPGLRDAFLRESESLQVHPPVAQVSHADCRGTSAAS